MKSLVDFALEERYKNIKNLDDRSGELTPLIDWEPFRQIVGNISTNMTDLGGRPNVDIVF